MTNHAYEDVFHIHVNPVFKVTATVYHATYAQNDLRPNETASGYPIDPTMPAHREPRWIPTMPGERIIALSQDLFGPSWKGLFQFGDIVDVQGVDADLCGRWRVADTMAKRFGRSADLLVERGRLGKWNQATVTLVYRPEA